MLGALSAIQLKILSCGVRLKLMLKEIPCSRCSPPHGRGFGFWPRGPDNHGASSFPAIFPESLLCRLSVFRDIGLQGFISAGELPIAAIQRLQPNNETLRVRDIQALVRSTELRIWNNQALGPGNSPRNQFRNPANAF